MDDVTPRTRLTEIARELKDGLRAYPVSVREILAWFGVSRRKQSVVERIAQAFQEHGLVCSPPIDETGIDAPVAIVLRGGSGSTRALDQDSGVSRGMQEVAEGVAATLVDPTFRLSRLPSANRPVTSVNPSESIQRAVTIMLAKGYSQLPVMTTPRELKGVFSWRSLGECRAVRGEPTIVRDCMVPAHERPAGESVFNALGTIVEHDYVLIRARDNTISGIVTASDLSLQFQQLAEPFLLIGEIENRLRRMLDGCLESGDLPKLAYPEGSEPPDSVDDLTFGQYQTAFAQPGVWDRLQLAIDQGVFCEQLEAVRIIRNDVMHFDPDPFEDHELATLRSFAELVRKLTEMRRLEARA